jgi:predicted GNAT superfamily acetyltransferase
VDRITWTYDPLISRNAYLNVSKLGAVCNTYRRNEYGMLRDSLNEGLPTDRFQVDWWVNSHRVNRRLSRHARRPLNLGHYLTGGAQLINPSEMDSSGFPHPGSSDLSELLPRLSALGKPDVAPILLVEIPSVFHQLKAANLNLALHWRLHTRDLFEDLFERGYLATDFVLSKDDQPRSFYVLVHGDSTL